MSMSRAFWSLPPLADESPAGKEARPEWAPASWEEGRCPVSLPVWGDAACSPAEAAVGPLALFGAGATHTRPLQRRTYGCQLAGPHRAYSSYQEFSNQDITTWSLGLDFGPTHWKGNIVFSCVWHAARLSSWGCLWLTSLHGKVTVVGGEKVTKSEGAGETKPPGHFNFYWSIIALQCCVSFCYTQQSESTLCIHISPLCWASLPRTILPPSCHLHRAEPPVLWSSLPLATCFAHGSCINADSNFWVHPSFPFLFWELSLPLHLYSCLANRSVCATVLDSTCMCEYTTFVFLFMTYFLLYDRL